MNFTKDEITIPVIYHDVHWTKRKLIREKYIEVQNGLCNYCGMPLSEQPSNEVLAKPVDETLYPENFFKHPIHLHHDHDTGLTIGAVHCYCNAVLWEYEGE